MTVNVGEKEGRKRMSTSRWVGCGRAGEEEDVNKQVGGYRMCWGGGRGRKVLLAGLGEVGGGGWQRGSVLAPSEEVWRCPGCV